MSPLMSPLPSTLVALKCQISQGGKETVTPACADGDGGLKAGLPRLIDIPLTGGEKLASVWALQRL